MKFTGVIAFIATAASFVSAAPLESRASDNASLGNIVPLPVVNGVGAAASLAGNGLGAVTDPITSMTGGNRDATGGAGGILGNLLNGLGLGSLLGGLGGAGGGGGGLLGLGVGGILKRSDE